MENAGIFNITWYNIIYVIWSRTVVIIFCYFNHNFSDIFPPILHEMNNHLMFSWILACLSMSYVFRIPSKKSLNGKYTTAFSQNTTLHLLKIHHCICSEYAERQNFMKLSLFSKRSLDVVQGWKHGLGSEERIQHSVVIDLTKETW